MKDMPYSYHFERTVFGRTLSIDITSTDGILVDFIFSFGISPHWHPHSDGTWLNEGSGERWLGFRTTRVKALKFATCAIANLHGFCIASANNDPCHPRRVHSPRKVREFNLGT